MGCSEEAGFSLIELIVVVAIMAVLVGILAPAYLKYVEKSRKSADIQMLSQVIEAAEMAATDMELHVPKDTEFVLTAEDGMVYFSIPVWGDETDMSATSDGYWAKALYEWKDNANNGDPYTFHSKDWKMCTGTVVGTVGGDGIVRWVLSGEVFEVMCDYSESFAGKLDA